MVQSHYFLIFSCLLIHLAISVQDNKVNYSSHPAPMYIPAASNRVKSYMKTKIKKNVSEILDFFFFFETFTISEYNIFHCSQIFNQAYTSFKKKKRGGGFNCILLSHTFLHITSFLYVMPALIFHISDIKHMQ